MKRAWHIGEYGEIYVADSEGQVKDFLAKLVGEDEAAESISDCFEELGHTEMDTPIRMEDSEELYTLRNLAASCDEPMQICSCY